MDFAISVEGVRKIYPLFNKKTDKIREALSLTGRKYHTNFEAVKGVTFHLSKGECVGLIGLNGSGKSTLLKMITGVIKPTYGSVYTNGKVAALLELGAGFNPEYTGIENIYLNTLLMGFSKEETDSKLNDIISFADIGDFIYQPVKTYSSGMFVRLAFSVAISVNPDILIIDEALSVGDIFFQQKCYSKIKELSDKATVLIVSHDLNAITKFCSRIMVLNHGVLIFDGDAREGIVEYYKVKQGAILDSSIRSQIITSYLNNSRDKFVKPEANKYSGKMDIVIEQYYYQIDEKPFCEYSEYGKNVYVKMLVSSPTYTENIIVGYQVYDKFGNEMFGETSLTSNTDNSTVINAGNSIISFQFAWPEVREGDYFITLGIGVGTEVLNQVEQCWINQAIHIVNTTHRELIYGIFNNQMDNFSIEDA